MNVDMAARKREVKKRPEKKVQHDILPADIDEQYTMKKFMAQRESQLSTSIVSTTLKKPSVDDVDRIVTEVAKDVSQVVDVDSLHQVSAGQTESQSTWLELPVNTEKLQKTDIKFDDFPPPPQTTPQELDPHPKGAVEEANQSVSVGKPAASYVDKTSTIQDEQATKDDMPSISAAKHDTFEMATSTDHKLKVEEDTVTEKDAVEAVFGMTTENANEILAESTDQKAQAMQSSKSVIEERVVGFEQEPDKMKLDEVKQAVHDDEKVKEGEREYEGEDWTELDQDRESSMSMYDDHHTLPDDQVYMYEDLRMSTDITMSMLSDIDPELAALSTTSVSHRDLSSPTLPFGSPTADVETTQDVQDAGTSENTEHGNPEAEMVKVIDKEGRTEIIVDVGNKKREDEAAKEAEMRNQRPTSSMSKDNVSLKADDDDADPVQNEGSVHQLREDDGDEEEVYSDNEDEVELLRLKSRHQEHPEENTDEVDPAINVKNSCDNEDKAGIRCPDTFSCDRDELEKHDAREKKVSASAGKTDEVNKKSTGEATDADDDSSVADEEMTEQALERVRSDTEEPELEHRNDYADDHFMPAAIDGAPRYLEQEHDLPRLTPLDTEEEPDEALRGEGPPMYDDEEAAKLYSLGEDGFPDFDDEYDIGIGTDEDEGAAAAEDDEHLAPDADGGRVSKLIGMTKPERMDDEVSILPEAAQSEEWDDALYELSNPTSAADLEKSAPFAEAETMLGVVANHPGAEEKITIEA